MRMPFAEWLSLLSHINQLNSMKGMGAAGVSVDDELARTTRLIAEAKKQGITIIGSHIEAMAEKAVESYWLPGDQLWSKYTNYF